MAVLTVSAVTLISYGPDDACRRMVKALDSFVSALAATDAPNWQGVTTD